MGDILNKQENKSTQDSVKTSAVNNQQNKQIQESIDKKHQNNNQSSQPILEYLEFDYSLKKIYKFIENEEVQQISDKLEKEYAFKRLTLNFQQSITTVGILAQISKSISSCTILRTLIIHLSDCFLDDCDLISLGNSLTILKNLNHFLIYLNNNNISDNGLQGLTNGFQNMPNLIQIDLDLSNNQFSNQGTLELGKCLSKCKNLLYLRLYFVSCNKLEGFNIFMIEISKIKSLKKFLLSVFGSEIDLNQIGSAINKCSFNKLDLILDVISFKYQLGEQLGECFNLTTLNLSLSSSLFSDREAVSFISGLQKNKNLRNIELKLDNNQLSLQGSLSIAIGISRMQNLISVSLNLSSYNLSNLDKIQIKKNIISKLKKLVKSQILF